MSILLNVAHCHKKISAINICRFIARPVQHGYASRCFRLSFSIIINDIRKIIFQRITDNFSERNIELNGQHSSFSYQLWIEITNCVATVFHLASPYYLPVFRQSNLDHCQELGCWLQLVRQVASNGK